MEVVTQAVAAEAQAELEETEVAELQDLAEHHLYLQLLGLLINMHMEVLVEHTPQTTDTVILLIMGTEILDRGLMERITGPQIIMELEDKEW